METDQLYLVNCSRLLPLFAEMNNFATEEVWADVKGYEGIYKISNKGNLKSLPRINCMGHPVKGGIRVFRNKGGYGSALLSKDRNKKEHSSHRLVAAAFLIQPEGKDQVNHKDGNKQNNNWWTLEWVTQEENFAHAVANNLIPPPHVWKERRRAERRQKALRLKEKDTQVIKSFLAKHIKDLASRFNVKQSTILSAARKLSAKDIEQETTSKKCDTNDIKCGYLCNCEDEFPQKRCGNESGGHCGGVPRGGHNASLILPRSPADEEPKKPDFQKHQAQLFFSWEKPEKRGEATITLPITTHPIRVEELTIDRSMDKRVETSDDKICTVEGCTNPRFDVGYGRCVRRCEHHHQERLRDGSRQHLVQVVYVD